MSPAHVFVGANDKLSEVAMRVTAIVKVHIPTGNRSSSKAIHFQAWVSAMRL